MNKYSFHRQSINLSSIDLAELTKYGIRGIILDLDNTLISEDDRYLSPGGETWIREAKLEDFKIFILSNGKRRYRVEYWSHRLHIPAINRAKKPFPFSFSQALAQMQLQRQQVVVIGDSRHTDVLGAWLTGLSSIQVASLPHPPRWWERILSRWLHLAYPVPEELLEFDSSQYV